MHPDRAETPGWCRDPKDDMLKVVRRGRTRTELEMKELDHEAEMMQLDRFHHMGACRPGPSGPSRIGLSKKPVKRRAVR